MELPELVRRLFPPGAVCTFIGAGGKSTAMRAVARILSARGIRVRMTTTTRVGIAEFMGFPVSRAETAAEVLQACDNPEPVRLIVADELSAQGKYAGLDPSLVEGLKICSDSVLLVEGDGSRRRPLKVPTQREPVIPGTAPWSWRSWAPRASMQPIDEEHCYNHEATSGILAPGARDSMRHAWRLLHPVRGAAKGSCRGWDSTSF